MTEPEGTKRRIPLSFVILAASTVTFAQTYTIKTFAGGYLPVNIPGTSASLRAPLYVAADSAGNVFFSIENHAVLRLDAATGILTVAAGNGTAGYSGDGGPATSAQLNHPYGIVVDTAGNLYIADQWNNVIRKVSNGIITTIAGNGTWGSLGDGGPATLAQLGAPISVAVDSAGNLYIGEFRGKIRKVAQGIISTVAGNGTSGYSGDGGPATAAEISQPYGLAVDASGNVYIGDAAHSVVRKISNGVISTVAGTGTYGYSGDYGPAKAAQLFSPCGLAVDSAGTLYVADSFNSVIRKVVGETIYPFAGTGLGGYSGDGGPASSAMLARPLGLAVDSAGDLYVADELAFRVRKISPSGVITTAAGDYFPGGVTIDAYGHWQPGVIGDDGPIATAPLNQPADVALANGDFYIAECGGGRVRQVSNGMVTTVAGMRYGTGGDGGPAISAPIRCPAAVALDSTGNLYIADMSNPLGETGGRVRKVFNGVITTVAGTGVDGFSGDNGPAAAAQLSTPIGIAVDLAGNLYVADSNNNRIRRISNGVITTVAGTGEAGFAGDFGPATAAQLHAPRDIALDSAGNLYIADIANNRVRKVSNGVITTVAGNGLGGDHSDPLRASTALLNPQGLAVDSAGNLYVAEYTDIRKISNGVITTIAGGPVGFGGDDGPGLEAKLNNPTGLTVDSSGVVYFADSQNDRIRELIPSGPSCTASATSKNISLPVGGGAFSVPVQADPYCPWAVGSLPDWISLSANALNNGSGAASFQAAPNGRARRTATISIAGTDVRITQEAAPAKVFPQNRRPGFPSQIREPAR